MKANRLLVDNHSPMSSYIREMKWSEPNDCRVSRCGGKTAAVQKWVESKFPPHRQQT